MYFTKVIGGGGGFGVLFKQAINPEERVTHSLRHSAAWQARLVHMEPSLGGMTASPSHSFVLIFLFLSPVSWTPGCLIQQQRGRSSRARRRGLGVEHEVQEGYTGVRLPLSGTRSPSASFSHTSPRLLTGGFFHDKRGVLPTNPCFAHPSLSSSSSSSCVLTPLTLQPSCTLWVHRTGIHLHHIYPQTHVREVPEKTCGAGVESEHRSRIKCVGPCWLSCASKQGPCVQTS